MPRGTGNRSEPGTAVGFALPDDIRRDLLNAQAGQIESSIRLPQVKVMAAGVGMYEFTDTTERAEVFEGVVLGSHPRNVLWDKKYGEQSRDEQQRFPACSSPDGRFGIPRVGFHHANLGRDAIDGDRIPCDQCVYNRFGSGAMLLPDKNPRGKAVTNQRSVFVMMAGRLLPVELILSSTNIAGYDEYLARLLNRGIPVQSVWTTFTQEVLTKGTLRWAVARFEQGDPLPEDEFHRAIAMMQKFEATIHPDRAPAAPEAVDVEAETVDDADEIGF